MGSLEGAPAPQSPQKVMGGIWVPLSYFTEQAEPLRPRGPPGVPVPKPRGNHKGGDRGVGRMQEVKRVFVLLSGFFVVKNWPQAIHWKPRAYLPLTQPPPCHLPATHPCPHNPFPALAAAGGAPRNLHPSLPLPPSSPFPSPSPHQESQEAETPNKTRNTKARLKPPQCSGTKDRQTGVQTPPGQKDSTRAL